MNIHHIENKPDFAGIETAHNGNILRVMMGEKGEKLPPFGEGWEYVSEGIFRGFPFRAMIFCEGGRGKNGVRESENLPILLDDLETMEAGIKKAVLDAMPY